jgi:type IV fimbrial biogenesis protein FimT
MLKKNFHRYANDSRGFTLLEMMIVVSIAGILLAIGVPSFRSMIQSQRMVAATNEFFAAILLTRSEAIERGGRVDLVPADANDWNKGWVVFVDANDNQRPDRGEQIIFSHGPVSRDVVVQSVLTDSKSKYLSYNGSGRTHTNASSMTPQFGHLSFTTDEHARKIIINFLGRPRICNPSIDKSSC